MSTLIGDASTLIAAVSRSPNKLDIFTTDTSGQIWTAAWEPGFTQWAGPWLINTNNSRAGSGRTTAAVSAVSRSADKLDIFASDWNGIVQTAAWEPGFSQWRNWRQVAGGFAAIGAPVTAVSRNQDKLDIFAVGLDGHVYTAAWEPDFGSDWHGWWRIGDAVFPLWATVHAVSRSHDKIDIFATDVNGAILTSGWEPGFTQWGSWRQVAGGTASPGAHVTAVSRSADKLDIFVVTYKMGNRYGNPGGEVFTAAWEPDFGEDWHGWWPVGDPSALVFAADGAPVGVVSRSTDKIDIFVSRATYSLVPGSVFPPKDWSIDTQSAGVWTSAWQPGFTEWRPWRAVAGGGPAHWGSPVTAVSRSTDKLDIFATVANGTVQTAAWEPDFGDWHGWWPT